MTIIKTKIKELIKKNNISQTELARLTGITDCTMSRYMSGQRIPTVRNLVRIAKALNTSTDYLLGLKAGGRDE